jgi:hypothetical protein
MNKIITIQCNRCKKDIHLTERTYRNVKSNLLFPWIWCLDCEKSFKEASLFIDNEIANPRNKWNGTTVTIEKEVNNGFRGT